MISRIAVSTPLQKPFLKWAGNKYQIIGEIRKAAEIIAQVAGPGALNRYIEPFLGSAAVFLSLPFEVDQYVLADFNHDLVYLFLQLENRPDLFLQECQALYTAPDSNTERVYYQRREEFNRLLDPSGSVSVGKRARRAALFVYLNRHCFNGLCRYNSRGEFNVPFGKYKAPYFPEAEMRAFAQRITGGPGKSRAQFFCGSFEMTLEKAAQQSPLRGSLIYCDPPYIPLSATSSFTAYAQEDFGPNDQCLLAKWAERAASEGAWVLLSNHDTEMTRALYDGSVAGDQARENLKELLAAPEMTEYRVPTRGRILGEFGVQRFISANGSRDQAPELLALFGPDAAAVEEACRLFREWQAEEEAKKEQEIRAKEERKAASAARKEARRLAREARALEQPALL